MREGIEQFKKEPEKSVLEEIWQIKKREEVIKKENPTHGSAWNVIDPEKLVPETLKLFESYKAGNLDSAKEDIPAVREKIKKIKDRDKRENNQQFISWVDDEIGREFLGSQLKKEGEMDNAR